MYLDAFTVSALVDEFLDVLAGGRIQDSIDTDDAGLGLEIYAGHRRHYLYLSADNRAPRVHLTPEKLRRGVPRPTNLGLLFRRYVEGGLVAHVHQPPWERLLALDVDGPEGPVTIVVEPMERRANLLLVQHGVILDCIRRVGPDENRVRVSLPNHPYVPPPPQVGKVDPGRVGLEDMLGILSAGDDPKRKAHQALTGGMLGVSPLLAREIVQRAGIAPDTRARDADPRALQTALRDLIDPLLRRDWQPGVAGAGEAVEAFSVYPLRTVPGWRRAESISDALWQFYGPPVGEEAYDAARQPVRAAIAEARARLSAKLASLERSMTDDSERETLRQSGELILAYQYTLRPGQAELRAQYDPDGPELAVPLDTAKTPLENAQAYFDRYNRAKRALEDVPALIAETRASLAHLAQLETDLALASSWPDIDEVQAALQAGGYWRGPRRVTPGGQKSAPLRIVTPEGFVLWVGRNSRQNEVVTFDKGSPGDLWLHARGVPGAHVIVKAEGRPVPETVIERAAELAAHYSGRRADTRVEVDVTERRHVRKIKGAAAGMVTYRQETTHAVTPRGESEQ